MGSISYGIPKDLAKSLANAYRTNLFVETGTYLGETAKWASSNFDRVLTCEPSPEIYKKAAAALKYCSNINLYPFESTQFLTECKQLISDSISPMFWLDAHPKDGLTYGVGKQIPLLDELSLVFGMHQAPIILIDDIRIFGCPEYYGFESSNWPSIIDIINKVPREFKYYQYGDIAILVNSDGMTESSIFRKMKDDRTNTGKASLLKKLFAGR